MNPKTFGAIRRAVAVARKAQRDADMFEKQGFADSAVIADAYAYGIYNALREALYGDNDANVCS